MSEQEYVWFIDTLPDTDGRAITMAITTADKLPAGATLRGVGTDGKKVFNSERTPDHDFRPLMKEQ